MTFLLLIKKSTIRSKEKLHISNYFTFKLYINLTKNYHPSVAYIIDFMIFLPMASHFHPTRYLLCSSYIYILVQLRTTCILYVHSLICQPSSNKDIDSVHIFLILLKNFFKVQVNDPVYNESKRENRDFHFDIEEDKTLSLKMQYVNRAIDEIGFTSY
jgi:hypothetical protein